MRTRSRDLVVYGETGALRSLMWATFGYHGWPDDDFFDFMLDVMGE